MANNNKKPKVLVIDDETLMVKAIKKKLDDNGFDTLVANNGQKGLDLAFSNHPDLILLDMVLPVMDGITILDKLRKDSWGAKVPVIVLSNLSRATTIEESRKRGVSTYLVKTDWTIDEVLNKVKYELGIL